MGQQVTFFTQKRCAINVPSRPNRGLSALLTREIFNVRNVIISENNGIFKTQKFSRNLFSPIELFHFDIFRDEISLIGEA